MTDYDLETLRLIHDAEADVCRCECAWEQAAQDAQRAKLDTQRAVERLRQFIRERQAGRGTVPERTLFDDPEATR